MKKVTSFTDSDGHKIHTLEYRGARIRVRTWKTEMSGTRRHCDLVMPDGKSVPVSCVNTNPYSLQGYDSVATIISDCKFRVREWLKRKDKGEPK